MFPISIKLVNIFENLFLIFFLNIKGVTEFAFCCTVFFINYFFAGINFPLWLVCSFPDCAAILRLLTTHVGLSIERFRVSFLVFAACVSTFSIRSVKQDVYLNQFIIINV